MDRTVRLRDLLLEDFRSLPRARFALSTVTFVALALTFYALVVLPSPLGPWSFALVVYGFGPVVVGAFAAFRMAGLRAPGHADSLFTMPVRSRTVLLSHLLLCLGVAGFYLLATLPFLALTAYHVGLPVGVDRLFVGGVVLLVFAVALGTLIGAFFSGRSVAVPVGLTACWLFLSMMAVIANASLQTEGQLAGSMVMRTLHVSPYVLASDGLGALEPSVEAVATAPIVALVILAIQVTAMLALAWRMFVHEQGPQRWEASGRRRLAFVVVAAAVLLATPAVFAGDDYAPGQPKDVERLGSSNYVKGAAVALVKPGGPPTETGFSDGRGGTTKDPLDTMKENDRDLLVRVPISSGVLAAQITFETDPWLKVTPKTAELGNGASAKRHEGQWVFRVPVTLLPMEPLGLKNNVYQLWTNVTYQETASDHPIDGASLVALEAEVPWVEVQIVGIGAPLVAVPAAWAVIRRIRVGGSA